MGLGGGVSPSISINDGDGSSDKSIRVFVVPSGDPYITGGYPGRLAVISATCGAELYNRTVNGESTAYRSIGTIPSDFY